MIVKASVAVSLDGHIDDRSPDRLMLSSGEDWAEVRAARAACDAVLVGAGTIRRDNPALVTRDEALREERLKAGLPADPVKVTLSRDGHLDPEARFFTEGVGEKIVFLGAGASPETAEALASRATVVLTRSEAISPREILRYLEERGFHSLFIEGGTGVLTAFLEAGAVDFLRLAVAPFFVGQGSAPRFVAEGIFPHDKNRRMHLLGVHTAGDMAVLEYALRASAEDYAHLEEAIAQSRLCPPSEGAYSVGALIITSDGQRFTGYSRETAPDNHAEEEAILKARQSGASLEGAVIYSSMEPCSTRKSKELSCSELIIENRMARVVFAAYEPDRFVDCRGERLLEEAGIEVAVIDSLREKALKANDHLQ